MGSLAGVLVLLASFPGLNRLQFLHTASDQKLEVGRPGNKARYCSSSVHLLKTLMLATVSSRLFAVLGWDGIYQHGTRGFWRQQQ